MIDIDTDAAAFPVLIALTVLIVGSISFWIAWPDAPTAINPITYHDEGWVSIWRSTAYTDLCVGSEPYRCLRVWEK